MRGGPSSLPRLGQGRPSAGTCQDQPGAKGPEQARLQETRDGEGLSLMHAGRTIEPACNRRATSVHPSAKCTQVCVPWKGTTVQCTYVDHRAEPDRRAHCTDYSTHLPVLAIPYCALRCCRLPTLTPASMPPSAKSSSIAASSCFLVSSPTSFAASMAFGA